MATLTEIRINKGVKWLDKTAPGWDRKIDLDKLNLADYRSCVLGQVFERDLDMIASNLAPWSG